MWSENGCHVENDIFWSKIGLGTESSSIRTELVSKIHAEIKYVFKKLSRQIIVNVLGCHNNIPHQL